MSSKQSVKGDPVLGVPCLRKRRSRNGRSCKRSRRDAVEWRKGPVNDPESAVPEGCEPAWANEKRGDPVVGVPACGPGGTMRIAIPEGCECNPGGMRNGARAGFVRETVICK